MTEEVRRNVVNQLAGIVEEYASAEFVVAVCGRGLNDWLHLAEQVACFDDFFESTVGYLRERGDDPTPLETFAETLFRVMNGQGELSDADVVRSRDWASVRPDAETALPVLYLVSEFSREHCLAMRANRWHIGGRIPLDQYRFVDEEAS
jgi:hypothetical protein